jgi:threonine/homoserine/homoserine lactone efflux protein
LRPGGRSPFEVKALPVDSPRRLFAMGLLTNLLNPKILNGLHDFALLAFD